MAKVKTPNVLFYDIETSPLQAYVWSCGKQYVGHNQLAKGRNQYGIICITYCFNDGKPAKAIDWGYEEQNTSRVVGFFDQVIKTADFVVGKNNKRFDDKMINAARMLNGLAPYPEWVHRSEDLEKYMRKYFRLPSQSLDYISNQLGLGGKIKMCMQDWIDIVEKNKNGRKSLEKMIKYGKKDVEDTRKLWYMLEKHFETRINKAAFNDITDACKHCASKQLKKNGQRFSGGIKYQEYLCLSCGRYAGKARVSVVTENPGRIS